MPPKILNILCDSIAHPITEIANMSFLTGTHPERLKIAKVIQILKSGSKMLTSNYRPISLLSNFNKIIEKLVFTAFNLASDQNTLLHMQSSALLKKSRKLLTMVNLPVVSLLICKKHFTL